MIARLCLTVPFFKRNAMELSFLKLIQLKKYVVKITPSKTPTKPTQKPICSFLLTDKEHPMVSGRQLNRLGLKEFFDIQYAKSTQIVSQQSMSDRMGQSLRCS